MSGGRLIWRSWQFFFFFFLKKKNKKRKKVKSKLKEFWMEEERLWSNGVPLYATTTTVRWQFRGVGDGALEDIVNRQGDTVHCMFQVLPPNLLSTITTITVHHPHPYPHLHLFLLHLFLPSPHPELPCQTLKSEPMSAVTWFLRILQGRAAWER